jgi:hypothetical protein
MELKILHGTVPQPAYELRQAHILTTYFFAVVKGDILRQFLN